MATTSEVIPAEDIHYYRCGLRLYLAVANRRGGQPPVMFWISADGHVHRFDERIRQPALANFWKVEAHRVEPMSRAYVRILAASAARQCRFFDCDGEGIPGLPASGKAAR